MQSWRLSGQPKHGIGFDWGLEDRAAANDTGPECWQQPGISGGSQPSRGSRKRPRAAGVGAISDEDDDEVHQQKVVRICAGGLGMGGAVGAGSLYSFMGADPYLETSAPAPEPEVLGSSSRDEWPDEEDLDWIDPVASPAPQPSPSPPPDETRDEMAAGTLEAEVERILALPSTNHRAILNLTPEEWSDSQAIQSKYRHLMRLLHPDKRRKDEVEKAGGKQRCDEVVSLVQKAVTAAKKAAQDDPRLKLQAEQAMRMQEMQREQSRQAAQRQRDLYGGAAQSGPPRCWSCGSSNPWRKFCTSCGANREKERSAAGHEVGAEYVPISPIAAATRMQEIQRTQARQAMQRQQQQQQANREQPDVGSLLASLSRVTGAPGGGQPASTTPAGSSNTTAQILGLLASLGK